jgi:hypothetical protein
MTSPAAPGAVAASTASSVSAINYPIAVNAVLGKVYDVSPLRKALYGEYGKGQTAQQLRITLT